MSAGEVLAGPRCACINWSRRVRRRPRARITRAITLRSRAELPATLNPRRIYQLGAPGKWALLECPCGRGHRVELNLAHPGRARWTLTPTRRILRHRPSVSPSIDVRSSRRCHFWLRAGRVRWVHDRAHDAGRSHEATPPSTHGGPQRRPTSIDEVG